MAMHRDASVLFLARSRAALIALCGLLVVGCATRPRKHRAGWARIPAEGTPATCPDHPVDVWGDRTPGPNDLRCSYEGTAGGQLVQLRGTVAQEDPNGPLNTGLADRHVEVFAMRSGKITGDRIGTTRSDAQGRFSFSVVLRPGVYVVRIVGSEDPSSGYRFEVEPGTGKIDDVSLLVPSAAESTDASTAEETGGANDASSEEDGASTNPSGS